MAPSQNNRNHPQGNQRSRFYSDRQRRAAQRRKKWELRVLCLLLFLVLAALVCILFLIQRNGTTSPSAPETTTLPPSPVLSGLTIEAGTALEAQHFLAEPQHTIQLITDLSAIDLRISGEYSVELEVDGAAYTSQLTVVDTVPPTGKPIPATTDAGILPDPQTLVTDLQDVSGITVSYVQTPDVSQGGEIPAQVQLTDGSGNTTIVEVPLTVIADTTPPVIEGAVDLEVFLGEPISYKAGITVTDDKSPAPKLTVDNSQVNTSTAGTYPVTYTATDDSGNTTSITIQLTLTEKPANYIDPAEVERLAQEVLDEITTEDMTPMQVAFAIYEWTRTHIAYTGSSEKDNWVAGAYQAFTKRSGDCFNYFAAAKALYNAAGIDNVDVVKSDTSHSSHFWSLINLGDGWYHVDCTPRRNPGKFFMNTDAELEAYSVKNKNSHIFDGSLYPERSEVSVQDLVDYSSGKVRG